MVFLKPQKQVSHKGVEILDGWLDREIFGDLTTCFFSEFLPPQFNDVIGLIQVRPSPFTNPGYATASDYLSLLKFISDV
jgi:hypothetical protein